MHLSKLSQRDLELVEEGLSSHSEFVRSVAESVQRTDTITDKQRMILINDSSHNYGDDYDVSHRHLHTAGDAEYEKEMNELTDAIGGDPWRD